MQEHSRALNGLPGRSVARPGPWGNPFPVGEYGTAAECVAKFREWLKPDEYDMPLHELRGHNLACFCPLDAPCHADVLIEAANALPAHPTHPDWRDV